MRVSTVFADYPLTGGIMNNRVRGNVVINETLSPITFKLVLFKDANRYVKSSFVRKLTKVHPTYVFTRAAFELRECKVQGHLIFDKVKIKPFGRERRLDFVIHPKFISLSQGTVEIPDEQIIQASNSTPYELLFLLLAYRYQKRNYLDFLVEYFLGVKLEYFDEIIDVKESAKIKEKINRVFVNVLNAAQKFGIEICYKTERIPVGKYTTKWFSYMEFKCERGK